MRAHLSRERRAERRKKLDPHGQSSRARATTRSRWFGIVDETLLVQSSLRPPRLLCTLLVVTICAAYLLPSAYRGWIPHDQGILAQSAERVLQGEIPHRDFDELYTGGLSYLNAAAFWVLGIKLSSIRTTFLLFSVAFIWVLHRFVRRLVPAGIAEVTVLAAVAWSLPNYFEAMPSWYNLFFIIFGMSAVLRFIDSHRAHWLVLAGFWGGVSVLFKIVGLYYIAAILLFLAYHAQSDSKPELAGRTIYVWLLPGITLSVCLVWLTLVVLMTRRNADAMLLAQLVVPSVAVAIAACHQAFWNSSSSPTQWHSLLRSWSAFSIGMLAPVASYLVFYIYSDALEDLFRGLLVLPFARLTGATFSFPNSWSLLGGVGALTCLGLALSIDQKWDKVLAVCSIVCAGIVIVLPTWIARETVMLAARMAPPALAITCSFVLIAKRSSLNGSHRQQLFLILTVASFCSLSQFPFAAPIYFCFVAPLFIIQFQYACQLPKMWLPATAWSVGLLGLLFGLIYVNRFSFFEDPRLSAMDPPVNAMNLPRAGLHVTMGDKETYESLVREIQSHSQPGDAILATPDCPEVYFLSERKNPTRTLLELFDSVGENQVETTDLLARFGIELVVINLAPKHSAELPAEAVSELVDRFLHTRRVGNFLVCFDRKVAPLSPEPGKDGLDSEGHGRLPEVKGRPAR